MGCISDTDPQPLLVRSHLGLYAICTVGIINNIDELIEYLFLRPTGISSWPMSSGKVNVSELVAALINHEGKSGGGHFVRAGDDQQALSRSC